MLQVVLIVVLVLLLLGAIGTVPLWPHSAGWGYYPSGGLTFLVVIVLLVLLVR